MYKSPAPCKYLAVKNAHFGIKKRIFWYLCQNACLMGILWGVTPLRHLTALSAAGDGIATECSEGGFVTVQGHRHALPIDKAVGG